MADVWSDAPSQMVRLVVMVGFLHRMLKLLHKALLVKLLQKVVKKTAKDDESFEQRWQQHVGMSGQPGLSPTDATKDVLVTPNAADTSKLVIRLALV